MKEIKTAEFDKEVIQSTIPVLVDFFSDGCTPCDRTARLLEQLEPEVAGSWKLVKMNATKEEELAIQFRLMTVPTLLAFRGGQCVAQRGGGSSKNELLSWLREV